jgi:uracil-DNA glycosylase family 4
VVALTGPDHDCALCPRLARFRQENRDAQPDWHNAPVPSFGRRDARLLIVGLAPGRRGANRTGRPFTGDFAGDVLYPALLAHGFARGDYRASIDDGFELNDCRVSNAVRCVPPLNRPTTEEIRTCGTFLAREMDGMASLTAILALGRIAHDAVLRARKLARTPYPFAHARHHALADGRVLIDSYHTSRLNTNTGRLTDAMFMDVVRSIRLLLADAAGECLS